MIKKNRKKIIILIILILIVSFLGAIIVYVRGNNLRNADENLKYINSSNLDKIDNGTVSPKGIDIISIRYKGELSPISISKSTYYFSHTLVPKYVKKCKNDDETKKYFEEHKEDILKEIAIDDEEKFIKLLKELRKLKNENFVYEEAKFRNIENDGKKLKADLYIKYKNNEEICVKTIISSKLYSSKSSIKYIVE